MQQIYIVTHFEDFTNFLFLSFIYLFIFSIHLIIYPYQINRL